MANSDPNIESLLESIIHDQKVSLANIVRKTALAKAQEYLASLFSSVRVEKTRGNYENVPGPMLDFIHRRIDQIALCDKTHETINKYVEDNFQKFLMEELEIAVRDKARHEARKGAFSHIPHATPAPHKRSIHDPSPNKDVRDSLGVKKDSCSEECQGSRL